MSALQVAILWLYLQIGANAVENRVAIEDQLSKITNSSRRRFHTRYQHLYYGEPGSREDFPHLVRVRWNSPATPTTCAGALVTATWTLASAACFEEAATRMREANKGLTWRWPENCTMSGDGQTVDVEEIRIHDGYLREAPKSDVGIAVLKSAMPFVLNARLALAHLSQPMPSHSPTTVYACKVAGYGQWNGTERRHPSTRQISWYPATAGGAAHCQRLENDLVDVPAATATYGDVLCCARADDDMPVAWGGVATCSVEGDMGGVLSCGRHVVGVTAWMTFNVCAPHKPKGATVYTSVGHPKVYKWLRSVIPNMTNLHSELKGKNSMMRSRGDADVSSVDGRRCSSNTRCFVGITVVTFAVIVLLW